MNGNCHCGHESWRHYAAFGMCFGVGCGCSFLEREGHSDAGSLTPANDGSVSKYASRGGYASAE